jgi:hypothetical protein
LITARTRSDLGFSDLRNCAAFLLFFRMTVRETPGFARRDETNRTR